AKMRAVWLLIDNCAYEQVSAAIEEMAVPGNAFRHSAREALGLLHLDGRGPHACQHRIGAMAFLLELVERGQRPVVLVFIGKPHRRQELVASA
ncbi:hypothetical protein ACC724_38250, partial [Rhizobium ruizarguesonis]